MSGFLSHYDVACSFRRAGYAQHWQAGYHHHIPRSNVKDAVKGWPSTGGDYFRSQNQPEAGRQPA